MNLAVASVEVGKSPVTIRLDANTSKLLLTTSGGDAKVYTANADNATQHTLTDSEISAKSYVKSVEVTATISIDGTNYGYADGTYYFKVSAATFADKAAVNSKKWDNGTLDITSDDIAPLPVRITKTSTSSNTAVGDTADVYISFVIENNQIKGGKNTATFYLSADGRDWVQTDHKIVPTSFAFDVSTTNPGAGVAIEANATV